MRDAILYKYTDVNKTNAEPNIPSHLKVGPNQFSNNFHQPMEKEILYGLHRQTKPDRLSRENKYFRRLQINDPCYMYLYQHFHF